MKKYILLSNVFLLMFLSFFILGEKVLAAPVCPAAFEVLQPNGDVIRIKGYGDEFFSWKEDDMGNVIAYDKNSQSWKYAEIVDGKICPGSCEVGDVTPYESKITHDEMQKLSDDIERTDYSVHDVIEEAKLFSTQSEDNSVLIDQELLMILIEFNDVKMVNDGEFWHNRMFSTEPNVVSVVNYYKEVSSGLNIFKPADTSTIQDGKEGVVSFNTYTDVGFVITKCPSGVVKVSLDISHPVTTWEATSNPIKSIYEVVSLAVAAVDVDFDFGSGTHVIANIAGYDNAVGGDGKGQVSAHCGSGLSTPNGTVLGKYAVHGEMISEKTAVGIGVQCHELAHSVLDLPDMYAAFPASDGLGMYSLMSYGCWGTMNGESFGNMPTHLDPWSKIKLGYVTPNIVYDWNGNVSSVDPDNLSAYNVLEVRSKADPNQYFLIENRQLIGYDRGLYYMNIHFYGGSVFMGGIVVYHIDEGISLGNDCNANWKHSFISVEPASESFGASAWPMSADGENSYIFNSETVPSSNFHELGLRDNCTRLWATDCHPQTTLSGVTLEISSMSAPVMAVDVKVDEAFVIGRTGKKFAEIFPDMNFCEAVIQLISNENSTKKTADDIISVDDWIKISTVSSVDVSRKNICDLSGIEYFIGINSLECSENELKNLDISQNKQLLFINCSGNQLEKINLATNEMLIYIYCNNNRLTEMDISSCKNLQWLYCNDNRIEQIDITQNPYLYVIHCYGNYMSEFVEDGIIGISNANTLLGEEGTIRFQYYPQNACEWIYDYTGNAILISNNTQTPCTLITVLLKDDVPVTTVMREFGEDEKKTVSISFPEEYTQNSILKVKAFVWDSLLTMKPLSEGKTWNVSD